MRAHRTTRRLLPNFISQKRRHRKLPLQLMNLEERVTPIAGQLDPTFGTSGIVTTAFPSPSDDYGNSIAIDSQGRILVAGNSHNGNDRDFQVARLTSTGALDMSFG